jgi:uroporphyrinogen III methyltransferase / synthase
VLLPRGDRAAPELPRALRAAGAEVTEVVAYRTVTGQGNSEAIELIRGGRVDVVAFASPSAFHHFVESLGKKAIAGIGGAVAFAAIGNTTAAAIRDAGFEASIVAERPGAEAFAAAIEQHYRHWASQVKEK